MLNYFKAFTVFLLWASIALTSHYFISNKILNTCNTSSKTIETASTIKNIPFSITNAKNDTIFNFSEGFIINQQRATVTSISKIPYLTDSIQVVLTNNYSIELHIIGKYLQSESSTNLPENLGLQRAKFVKKELVSKGLDATRIKTFGEIFNFSYNSNGIYTHGIEMKFNTIPQPIIDSLEYSITNKTLYIEFKNDSLISTKKLKNYTLLLKQYLQKNATKKALITGHTDNLGYYDNNLIIGLTRANKVKEYFINNGINANKFNTLSKGESEPIAEKTTEKGRAKNRRIEIHIN